MIENLKNSINSKSIQEYKSQVVRILKIFDFNEDELII
ncbi:unnamed protein product [Commensalibacter papalotli (ex Botero et al. 2024)]|uniref:Integrase n=1 Tax=Commensalibacter papalotli (ex Botero et al. 2024) TaxID=2972766 RepID=A0ABM9HLW3_9PROT|nr:unnamed protein product [Commensalibacter papalotli (ex Botero et al. 2024)]CAI3951467.1 unnamed protein product [Commensalibacter papalotli (ex Botero et al. 2024)]